MIPPEVGHLMISSFEIQKYRCFSGVSAKGLSRINIIVGRSGTGKTALLEGLFLCAGGSPQHYFNILGMRGVLGQQLRLESEAYDQFFREMFYKFEITPISLRFDDSYRGTWTLNIGPGAQKQLVSPESGDTAIYTPIAFSAKSGSGKEHESTVRLEGGNLRFPPPSDPFSIAFLNNATIGQQPGLMTRFSQIVTDGREDKIIQALQALYEDIDDVRLVSYGGGNVLLASVKGLGRIPMGSVSGGINKYLSILVTIRYKQRSVVLIDELENGFYYANLTGAWKGIVEACLAAESQVFVSTHSNECLHALLPLLEEHSDHFTMIRTEKLQNEIVLVQFSGSELRDAIEHGFEVR